MLKPHRGWQAKIKMGGLEVGCASEVSINIKNELESYYEIENPNVAKIKEGIFSVEGTLKRIWINVYYLNLLLGRTAIPEDAFFDLELVSGTDTNSPVLYLYGCRFTKGRINIPQDGWLEEEYDFIAFGSAYKGLGYRPGDPGYISPTGTQLVPIPDLFYDGFESGDFSKWNATSNVSIITSPIHHGTKACYGSTGGGNAYLQHNLTSDSYFLRFYVYLGSFSGVVGSTDLLKFYQLPIPGATIVLIFYFNSGTDLRNLSLWVSGYGGAGNGTHKITMGGWTCITVEVHTGNNASLNVWVNSALDISTTKNVSSSLFSSFRLCPFDLGGGHNLYMKMDCILGASEMVTCSYYSEYGV